MGISGPADLLDTPDFAIAGLHEEICCVWLALDGIWMRRARGRAVFARSMGSAEG